MSKLKNPLHSLGATGSIGNSLSFANRRGVDIAEKRPIPSDRKTLSQMYHRWLYEDYAYLWRQQTPSVQETYRSLGAKCHLTGYQYWMSYQLTNLPDIIAWWRMDTGDFTAARDYSRNGNNGAIIGASPTAGFIDGALLFDGLNDKIVVPDSVTFDVDSITFEFLAKVFNVHLGYVFVRQLDGAHRTLAYFYNNGNFYFTLYDTLGNSYGVNLPNSYPVGSFIHFILTFKYPGKCLGYLNNTLIGDNVTQAHLSKQTGNDFYIGRDMVSDNHTLDGVIDNFIVYNRFMDSNEVTRHFQRRYPLI